MPDDAERDHPTDTESAADRANARLSEARERFQSIAGGLGSRVRTATDSARSKSSKLGLKGATVARRAMRSASSAGHQARERYGDKVVHLHQGYVQARDHVESWSDDIADYVRAHPGRAVMAAVVAGFVFGLLSRGRDG